MLTAEENQLLTRVGPGTPGGELLRRYWQPVGILPDLTDPSPTKHVRILGEDLVLFRDKRGRVGLLGDHCPHRGASLLYGRVEERGIACAYHGWLYDIDGNCLETPAEPANSKLYLTVKHRAYPVREYCGLYWAYLGPPPAPIPPKFDIAETCPITTVEVWLQRDCNWLQTVENHLDQAHVLILHQGKGQHEGVSGSNSTRGHIDELATLQYREAPFGIRRTQVHHSGYIETDLMIFPNALRIFDRVTVKVPIDDTHTRQYNVNADFELDGPSERYGQNGATSSIDYRVESGAECKSPPDAIHPFARYRMDQLRFQDFTVLETQGPIAARENERLGTSDRGVVLLRTILKREIEKVQQGLDPIGVVRDPERDLIDTQILEYIDVVRRFPQALPGGGRR